VAPAVRVELPLPVDASPEETAGATATIATSERADVLLVEDDPVARATLAQMLSALGHRVHAAAHGLEALSSLAVRIAGFDLALFDLDLPGVDGFELLRLLRAREEPGSGLPVLAISARDDPELDARCRDEGFQGFLRKPCSSAELAAALVSLRPPEPAPLPAAAT
jgi:CheY-like chemotaxis protein